MATLLIEPFGGVAGDMLLAALLDLEDPRFTLTELVSLAEELVPGEARLTLEHVRRASLTARLLTVETPEGGSAGVPPERHLPDLERILERSSLSEPARRRARGALAAIAAAEAGVHRIPVERLHLHEVGAVDTLIDAGGVALALERLGIGRVLSTPPLLGSGTVHCAHGELPVPAPAVVELLRGRPTVMGGDGERTTPTGAALLVTLTDGFAPPRDFTATAVGYGAGARDGAQGPPNLVRVQLGEESLGEGGGRREAWLLQVNLDDLTPEEVGHAVVALRGAGALEVWTAPAHMKKDRPGVVVQALAREGTRQALEGVCFELTTTLGLRWTRLERVECERRRLTVEVEGVAVRVKVRLRPPYPGRSPFGERDLAPEHDDLVRLAEVAGLTLREARRRALQAALELGGGASRGDAPGDRPGSAGPAMDPPRPPG